MNRISKYLNAQIRMVLVLAIFLLGQFHSYSQKEFDSNPGKKLKDFHKKVLQEKVFVHTDKQTYLAGEICWFRIFYLDASSHKPLDISKVVLVELLDRNNKPVMQVKVAMEKGGGQGSIQIPLSLNNGHYRLRAYTNWMKNFDPSLYFEKKLIIVNAFKSGYTKDTATTEKYQIDFFPEGGNLLAGHESKIAFKVSDQYGNGVYFDGAIINASHDTVARFSPLKFGIGNFRITPLHNQRYKAILKLPDGTVISRDLPEAYEKGYAMSVSRDATGKILVRVTADPEKKEVFLIAHTRQELRHAEKKNLVNGEVLFTLGSTVFGEGVSQLTIFNEDQKPVCERLFFIRPTQHLTAWAKPDKQLYGQRKKVNVQVEFNGIGAELPRDVSVTVHSLDELNGIEPLNIENYLWLSSDLKGKIESPEYYFSGNDAKIEAATDNLMLTHGWRRFSWEALGSKKSFRFIPEYKGHIISARIDDIRTGMPVKNEIALLSIPGVRYELYSAKSDAEGKVYFDVSDHFGSGEIAVRAHSISDSNYRVTVLSPFSEEYAHSIPDELSISRSWEKALTEAIIGIQAQNIYREDSLKKFLAPAVDTFPFYYLPDKRYALDEYTRFTTIEEILREYITEVIVRVNKKELQMLVRNELDKLVFKNDPLILFDGVPVTRQGKIFAYDPLKIKYVDVVSNQYFLGQTYFDGIVSFTTYNGDYADFTFDPGVIIVDYEGLQLQREFYSPQYEDIKQLNDRVPDLRNVLYWSPAVRSIDGNKAGFNFYTSDNKGKYVGILQGINEQGHTFVAHFNFGVE